MAATVEARRLTEAHRLAQARLGARTVLALRAVWPLLDLEDLDGTFDRWLLAALPIIQGQRSASATLAGNYLDLFKKLELGASASLPLVLAAPAAPEAVSTSLLVTGPVSIRRALSNGIPLATALSRAEAAAAGAGMRHALNGGRGTIDATIQADRQALGYARATSGKPCHFCAMLASRGPVYKGQDTADFKAHDHCSCSTEPVYRRDAAWPAGSRRYEALWQQAKRSDGDTEKNFRRLVTEAA